jgi:GTPase
MPGSDDSRCGLVAIIGRPNVGKSTLLNALVGEKVSIVSSKPHTTRHRILGVLNRGGDQAVFIDTPGHARRSKRALHRLMSRVIHRAIDDCDLALLLIDARGASDDDRRLFETVRDRADRVVLVLNKTDKLRSRADMLPVLDELKELPFRAFVPVSASTGDNLSMLVEVIFDNLPSGPAMFPRDMTTDRDLRFRAAETIREKLFAALEQEVPYGLTVEVEHMQRGEDGRWLIHGLIWLERESHKPIVIGKGGQTLKRVGRDARLELSGMLGARVHLELWAKVREHWSDSERELQRLGFDAR